jgi:hypothetical protein
MMCYFGSEKPVSGSAVIKKPGSGCAFSKNPRSSSETLFLGTSVAEPEPQLIFALAESPECIIRIWIQIQHKIEFKSEQSSMRGHLSGKQSCF